MNFARLGCASTRLRSRSLWPRVREALSPSTRSASRLDGPNTRLDVDRSSFSTSPTTGCRYQRRPAPDGIVRRIEVRSARKRRRITNGPSLHSQTMATRQIDRLLVVPHFRLAGSGLFWPDLGASRIASITPSQGICSRSPTKPGSGRLSHHAGSWRCRHPGGGTRRPLIFHRLYLWDADAYKDALNSYTVYTEVSFSGFPASWPSF